MLARVGGKRGCEVGGNYGGWGLLVRVTQSACKAVCASSLKGYTL